MKKEKGVAGLNIFLSVIAMLFIIGIILMIFSLAGSEIMESVTETSSGTFNETKVMLGNTTYVALVINSLKTDCAVTSLRVINTTTFNVLTTGNYTFTNCKILPRGNQIGDASSNYTISNWTLSGNYQWTKDSTSRDIINKTTLALSESVEWFDTFIVLAAMVVLILLVVIIINSIRQANITGEGGGQTGFGSSRSAGLSGA